MFDAQARCQEAVVQVGFVVVQGMLAATNTINHHNCYIENGDAQHHERHRQFRAAHDRRAVLDRNAADKGTYQYR